MPIGKNGIHFTQLVTALSGKKGVKHPTKLAGWIEYHQKGKKK